MSVKHEEPVMTRRYYDLNTYLRRRFGQRVHKISLDAGLTCPNRDGTLGTDGCIYCNAKGSGTGAHGRGLSIAQQLEASRPAIIKRFKTDQFIAYFQSFTNTYAPVEQLKAIYDEALSAPGVVGLAIGTRPDCVDTAVLDLLATYVHRGIMVWVEYGLQSANDATLKRIHRGHDVACFIRAAAATRQRGIQVCAHIILGLPGEDRDQMMTTADTIAGLGIDGVKLHLLYVVRGTAMETLYRRGDYRCLEQDEYATLVGGVIQRLAPEMVVQRLTGDPHPKELIAPRWALDKPGTMARIQTFLESNDIYQGQVFLKRSEER